MTDEIDSWLHRFEIAVRACDFEAGCMLFAPDAIAFGTRAEMARGLDRIVAEQWQKVWPYIHDFHLRSRVVRLSGHTAWVATMWETTRRRLDGAPIPRPGRGTFVLERRDGRWLAVHSHFSLGPEDPKL